METMERKRPRPRRSFTPEFKADIVERCLVGDRSVNQVAQDFDLTVSAVRGWVKQHEIDTELTAQSPVTGSSGSATTYSYDSLGDQVGATVGTTTTTYGYDQTGKMTSVATSGTSTSCLYNGDGLETAETTGGTTAQFTWATNAGLPLLLSDGTYYYIYGAGGTPVEQVSLTSSSATFMTYTPSDSTWLTTNAAGDETGFWGYDAFGTLAFGTPTSAFGYAGQYVDPTTGFSDLRARWYQPGTGEFTSVDPDLAATDEPYAYAGDDPVNEGDPLGLNDCWIFSVVCDVGHVAAGSAEDIGRGVAAGAEWALHHPLTVITIALSTASLVATLGADAPEVLAVDVSVVAAEDGGLSIAVSTSVEVEESALPKLLSQAALLTGGGQAALDCSQHLDATCAWDIASWLVSFGAIRAPLSEVEEAVVGWLASTPSPFPGPSEARPSSTSSQAPGTEPCKAG